MSNLIFSALPEPRRSLITVNPDVSLANCIDLMIKENIGALVVHDESRALGILSERDIVRAGLDKGLDIKNLSAGQVACADITILSINDTVEAAMQAITLTKRRHVLITEEEAVIAILSTGDLLHYLLADKLQTIEALKNYIGTDGSCQI